MMSKVKHYTDNNFKSDVLDATVPVLVDFWATWCGPCHMLAPIVVELAEDLNGSVAVGKLDVDDNPETAAKYNIRSIPTLILFRDGKEVTRLIGVRSKTELADTIKPAVGRRTRCGRLTRQIRTILPGFMMLSGSSACLMARMTLTASPCSATRKSILP